MKNGITAALALSLLAAGSAAAGPAAADRFEAAVRSFEQRDAAKPPPRGAVLFAGSSTIAGWDTAKSFPKIPTINRGIGGSQIADAVVYADRIAIPYAPRIIVFYAGDNDIAAGKSPQKVHDDFKAFVKKVRGALPAVRIVFLSIKPSPKRWSLWDTMKEANALIATFCKDDPQLTYLDVAPALLGKDDQPRAELFKEDGLHLNEAGYKAWTALLEPLLAEPAGKDR